MLHQGSVTPPENHGSSHQMEQDIQSHHSLSQQQHPEEPGFRIRTLTEKGKELYGANCKKYSNKLVTYRRDIESIIMNYSECSKDKDSITLMKYDLIKLSSTYKRENTSYLQYLMHINTEESIKELNSQEIVNRTVTDGVTSVLREMNKLISLIEKPTRSRHSSVKSYKTKVSTVSSATSSLEMAKQRAKADAAKAGLEFERQEMKLKKEKARLEEENMKTTAIANRKKSEIEADIDLLGKEKEAVTAEAEFNAFCVELDIDNDPDSIRDRNIVGTEQSSRDRTELFVKQHAKYSEDHISPQNFRDDCNDTVWRQQPAHEKSWNEHSESTHVQLNPTTPAFVPQENSSNYSDFTRFLLKKDLLSQRLSNFDDTPETFAIWKASFGMVMLEIGVSSSEELDMLLKYLGPESRKYAVSLRSSNASNPTRGLERLWERLNDRYGSPEMVESALKKKLEKFPKLGNRDNKRLYELSDILSEIESAMDNPKYITLLSYYNSSSGVIPIVLKLPFHLQNKWTSRAMKYKKVYQVTFPPFKEFCEFIREMSSMLNDPSFWYNTEISVDKSFQRFSTSKPGGNRQTLVHVHKTDIRKESSSKGVTSRLCPIHKSNHTLNQCRTFTSKTMSERKRFLREHNICYKCCESDSHVYKTCTTSAKCNMCGSDRHPTALHSHEHHADDTSSWNQHGREKTSSRDSSGDYKLESESSETVSNKCTNICGEGFRGRSCSKTILVKVYLTNDKEKAKTMYAILDDQSNRTLCKPEFFNLMEVSSNKTEQYALVSCAGSYPTQGRCAQGFTVAAIDDSFNVNLPSVLECTQIPDTRAEIATPDIAKFHQHLKDVPIPPLDHDSEIILLIGRDVPEAHHVYEQRTGPLNSPFAQKLGLGWVIVGDVCLGQAHRPTTVNVLKTRVLDDGRPTIFPQCDNQFVIKSYSDHKPDLNSDVFCQTKHDNKPGLSIEDKVFLRIMEEGFVKNKSGNWSAPLPFRDPRPRLPNNRQQAFKRAQILDAGLRRDPVKKQHFTEFMEHILENGHAEIAPTLQDCEECWYLPIFGVYHPKKKDKLRAVFDSSSKYEGISLNSVLLSGPDLTNSLIGILLRFREGPVAVTGDIEQMFYQFYVHEKDRNYLRFLWYENNDTSKKLIEYRMCVHVFGNSPSPAVASYGLRKTAENAAQHYGSDVKDFVDHNFYVDDGLASLSSVDEAVSLIQRTQEALSTEGNIRFHKIVSNNKDVLKSFPEEDLDKSLKNLDLEFDKLPVQRSLGLCWDLGTDCFIFRVSERKVTPYTKRGVLSTINSLYDPLGFLAPVTIGGRILLRDITIDVEEWDEPLPETLQSKWEKWEQSLQDLNTLKIPRTYYPSDLNYDSKKELHVFADASEKAIAAVAFLKTSDKDGNAHIGFVMGKSKVAPRHGHTIPRLELCAALLAVEIAEIISEEVSLCFDCTTFHTDSKVVLGYLQNKMRRFYVYVENRVSRILKFSSPEQWVYVPTENNPADYGTRYTPPDALGQCIWLTGVPLLKTADSTPESEYFPIVCPDTDAEIRPEVNALKTSVEHHNSLGTERFERFSSWIKLITALSLLVHVVDNFKVKYREKCQGWHICKEFRSVESQNRTKLFIIRQIQQDAYHREVQCLSEGKPVPKDSTILALSPFIDENGIVRVGGRLRKAEISVSEKNPILIQGRSHTATLLVRYYHESVHHQGRHFTEGAIRSAGYWITGGKRLISLLIHKCVMCRKLRGRLNQQKMSDLPEDRLTPAPPFSFVGVDVFGPWDVVTRRTRGGAASSKRWAVIFACQTTRAIHLELIEEMTSSSFINALRRFYAIRGKVKEFRSDRGTNFIGATDDLGINSVNIEDGAIRNILYESETVWKFNTPYSSHMGGAWERLIGVSRGILNAMLLDAKNKQLTHEVLSTFMAEVSAIVNARPIVPVSTDADSPFVLTPSILLTQKTGSPVEYFQHLDEKEMFTAHWKHVQVLADTFWHRWRKEYLPTIQPRQKWHREVNNTAVGDVVLLREKSAFRNEWPTGIVTRIFQSDDGLVRKVELRVIKDGKSVTYVRPVVELVKLV